MKNITTNYDRIRTPGRLGKPVAIAAFALCTLFAGVAEAQCGISKAPQATMEFRSSQSVSTQLALRSENTREGVAPEAPAAPNPPGPPNSIVGFWDIKFISGGQLVDEGFDQWHVDGTEILNDTPPPSTGNVCLGVYAQVPGSGPAANARPSYKLKHLSWTFDGSGNLNGTAVITEMVTVGPDNNTFTGTFTVNEYDLANNLVFHGEGQITAQRITAN